MRPKETITIQVGVDGNTFSLEDIPLDAWLTFQERAKVQFPQHKEEAWAAFLSEVIVSVAGGDGTRRSYFMTDVPEEIAIEMDRIMSMVGWTWDKFHAYLLRSVQKEQLHIISLHEEDGKAQNFGTVIVSGIRPEVFSRLEAQHKDLTIEKFMGTLFLAMAEGEMKLEPGTQWAEPRS